MVSSLHFVLLLLLIIVYFSAGHFRPLSPSFYGTECSNIILTAVESVFITQTPMKYQDFSFY